jgi:hypothetical protein
MKPAPTKNLTRNFRSLFFASLFMATLSFAVPFLIAPGARDGAIKVSVFLTMLWVALVIFAFARFKWRAFWFLLGTPLTGYWLFVLSWIASRCAENIKNCP